MTTFVNREQWRARPRESGTTSITAHPSVTFHYVGGGWEWPWDHSSCDDKVRAIQADHMDNRGWSDIAYNYLVCPHDVVYEGRGYDRRSSANGSNAANFASFAICALWGSASADDPLPNGLKRAFRWARSYLMLKGGASSVIKGHRDWKSTTCPGDQIYAWIEQGIPLPPTNEDNEMLSPEAQASVRAIFKEELKTATVNGQPLHELVQMYANAVNTYLNQYGDDLAKHVWDEELPDVLTTTSGDTMKARTFMTWLHKRVEQELSEHLGRIDWVYGAFVDSDGSPAVTTTLGRVQNELSEVKDTLRQVLDKLNSEPTS